jgi:hypothetical protein
MPKIKTIEQLTEFINKAVGPLMGHVEETVLENARLRGALESYYRLHQSAKTKTGCVCSWCKNAKEVLTLAGGHIGRTPEI